MKASLASLHHQATDWLRELEFYKQEIGILTKRLEEVVSKNTDKEIEAQSEHFQNKFILLREQMDELTHDVRTREREIEAVAKDRPNHIDEKFTAIKSDLLNRVKDLVNSIADTRFEFNHFLVQVL